MLGGQAELLLGRQHEPVGGPLPPHRAVAPAVRIPRDEDEARVAAAEVLGEERQLERVRVRLVEEAGAPGVARVDGEVLPDEPPELRALAVVRVRGGAAVEGQQRVAGVDAVVVRPEERMLDVGAVLAAPEGAREPRHPVADDAQLVDSGPVSGVAGHADDDARPAEAATDDRLAAALDTEEEDRPVERDPVDDAPPPRRRPAPPVAPVEADRLDRDVPRTRAGGAAGAGEQVGEAGEALVLDRGQDMRA